MRYRLGIEQTAQVQWLGWVFEMPGCYCTGSTRAEVIGNAGASIAAYHQWIARHRNQPALDDPYIDVHVAEVFQPTRDAPEALTNAFFKEDRLFLDREEVAEALELLAFTRADLAAVVAQVSPERRAASPAASEFESIDTILRHMASSEWWYLDRFGLASPAKDPPDDPLDYLAQVRAQLVRMLPLLTENERVVEMDGEKWSARKLIRRALWHERDHTQEIKRLIDAKTRGYIP